MKERTMAVAVGDRNTFSACLEWMCHGATELRVCYLRHNQRSVTTRVFPSDVNKGVVLEDKTRNKNSNLRHVRTTDHGNIPDRLTARQLMR